jgi:16S rRNA (adenine1518-N6/adenine1519-N6)-dimethyltransferase
VIRLTRKKNFKNLGCPENRLRTTVKAAFGMRRKMLRNSMKQFLPKNVIFTQELFTKRPENLSVQDYIDLTNLVIEHSPT